MNIKINLNIFKYIIIYKLIMDIKFCNKCENILFILSDENKSLF